MQKISALVFAALLAGAVALRAVHTASARTADSAKPSRAEFSSAGELVRPEGYRRWVYVSSGFGMSYNPSVGGNGAPAFTNVFVAPEAFDFFQSNGTWPNKTMFVLEIYGSTSRGSINVKGSYQEALAGLDVEIKDEERFPDKWAYFNFDDSAKTASATTPGKNACWTCHEQNAAVEHSFVQFYPELLKVARAKGTIKPTAHREGKK